MNRKFFLAAIAAVMGITFTGCSNDNDVPGANGEKAIDQNRINFEYISENAPATRGLAANLSDVKADGFKVWAFNATKADATGATPYMGTKNVGLTSTWQDAHSAFVPSTNYYWPEYKLSFMALTPMNGGGINESSIEATQPEAGIPQLKLDVDIPTTLAEQKDIMIACNTKKGFEDVTGGNVQMLFKHALSQIVFKGRINSASVLTKVEVKNIAIVNVASDGTITYTANDDQTKGAFATGSQGVSNKTFRANIVNMNVTYKGTGTDYDDITGSNLSDQLAYNGSTTRKQQIMMLPQVVNSGKTDGNGVTLTQPTSGTYIQVNADFYANNNNSNKVVESTTNIYIPLNETEWKPGFKYTYLLTFGDTNDSGESPLLHPITFSATVDTWQTGESNLDL